MWFKNHPMIIFGMFQFIQKQKDFDFILKQMEQLHVKCSRPIALGQIGTQGYVVTSYVEGKESGRNEQHVQIKTDVCTYAQTPV